MDYNPVKEQDRAEDLIDNWRKYGYVMFPQQRRIYEQLAEWLARIDNEPLTVLEAGCGSGQGTAMLYQAAMRPVVGTDVSRSNVDFARCLYPWIDFKVWNVMDGPTDSLASDIVVAVEVVEHVADAQIAVRNLIDSAYQEVWISTPNGNGKTRPPSNPFHVREYTVAEMLTMICLGGGLSQEQVTVMGWEEFEPASLYTTVSPLVYRIQLR